MATKACFKCNRTLPLESFYRHPQMADGHVNKCKECNKLDVKVNYRVRIDQYKDYERQRAKDPERRQKKSGYEKTHNIVHEDRYVARYTVSNAVRDGRLTKQPCSECGSTTKVEAHHADYSKPLDVRWLCFDCHRTEEHSDIYNVQASRVVVDKYK